MSLLTTLKCRTKDCPNIFPARSNGHKFCKVCAVSRKREQNRRSNVEYEKKTDMTPTKVDLTDAEIDQRFTSALSEIRRSGVHRVEAGSFDYRDRYREP